MNFHSVLFTIIEFFCIFFQIFSNFYEFKSIYNSLNYLITIKSYSFGYEDHDIYPPTYNSHTGAYLGLKSSSLLY